MRTRMPRAPEPAPEPAPKDWCDACRGPAERCKCQKCGTNHEQCKTDKGCCPACSHNVPSIGGWRDAPGRVPTDDAKAVRMAAQLLGDPTAVDPTTITALRQRLEQLAETINTTTARAKAAQLRWEEDRAAGVLKRARLEINALEKELAEGRGRR